MSISIADTTYQTCPHVGCNNLHPIDGDILHINHADIQHDPDPEDDPPDDQEEEEDDDEGFQGDDDHEPPLNE